MRNRTPNPTNPNWVVIPFLDEWEMTKQTLLDCLAMRVGGRRPNVMLVDNGSAPVTTGQAVLFANACFDLLDDVDVILTGHPAPGQPLNHAWNIALWQIWEFGGEQALVVNNDVRLHAETFSTLLSCMKLDNGLLVSAVNAGGFPATLPPLDSSRGGPDYSCFMISKACHERFMFDPRFTWFGDNNHVREIWLAGEGHRIYSVNLPYEHIGGGSQTIKRSPAVAARNQAIFQAHRDLYLARWGGLPHQETYARPDDPSSTASDVQTPGGCPGDAPRSAIQDSQA